MAASICFPLAQKGWLEQAELIQVQVEGLLEPLGSLPAAPSPLPTVGWGGREVVREKSFPPSLRGGQLFVLALLPKGLVLRPVDTILPLVLEGMCWTHFQLSGWPEVLIQAPPSIWD